LQEKGKRQSNIVKYRKSFVFSSETNASDSKSADVSLKSAHSSLEATGLFSGNRNL
jgi:hypothetical protein